jgi:hypothetical protein
MLRSGGRREIEEITREHSNAVWPMQLLSRPTCAKVIQIDLSANSAGETTVIGKNQRESLGMGITDARQPVGL